MPEKPSLIKQLLGLEPWSHPIITSVKAFYSILAQALEHGISVEDMAKKLQDSADWHAHTDASTGRIIYRRSDDRVNPRHAIRFYVDADGQQDQGDL